MAVAAQLRQDQLLVAVVVVAAAITIEIVLTRKLTCHRAVVAVAMQQLLLGR